MSDHLFSGHGSHVYPHSKDAAGQPIGEVTPGDVRDLDEPLDHNWLPCKDDAGKTKKAAAKDADSEKASAAKTSGGEKASAGK